ncbi:MAG: alpha/beta hydrolase [Spirochaetes bacterium]|nr:alpha/beta hydrolase [Spirochaetota bacterium]
MTKKISLLMLCALLAIPHTLLAGGSSNSCTTRYPIVLSHGMGTQAMILGIIDYWAAVTGDLEENGADVYITSVNAMDSTANKGLQWKLQVLQILAITGKSKINVIGHSHGAIYTRYAISNLGMASRVASHTSIAGPHRGSVIADIIMGIIPNSLEWLVGGILDIVMSFLMGDVNGNSVANGYDLVRSHMINVFNPNTPNMPGVYYQSWAYKIKLPATALAITWAIMLPFEGANDGLVSVNSAKWGNFRGTIEGAWWGPGVDHMQAVGILSLPAPGYDPGDHFVQIVSDLKNRGY